MIADMKPLPCPFCNAPAETDLHRGFIDYKRQPGEAVAIYCTECDADMTLCRGDFPGDAPEHLLAILMARWNRRSELATLKAERDELRECLEAIATDYEQMLGDGLSQSNAPVALAKARAILSKQTKP